MHIKKSRWSRNYEAAEEELLAILQSDLDELPERVTLPDQETIEFAVKSDTTLWCAEGSLTISNNNLSVALQTGDMVYLASNQSYTILSGFTGCVYYQEP